MRTKAIVLKKQNTNEYDQLVTCYTEEFGKLTAVAKSVLKPNSIQAMHLDVFNLVDFDLISGRGTPIVTGAQVENSYRHLKNDIQALAMSYFFTEIIDKIAFEYQKDEGLWDFLTNLMTELNSEQKNMPLFYNRKQTELLEVLGYVPNLENCVFCSNRISALFSAYNAQAGGAVCRDCFLDGQGGIVVKGNDILNSQVLNSIFESLAERRLSSLNFLNSVLR